MFYCIIINNFLLNWYIFCVLSGFILSDFTFLRNILNSWFSNKGLLLLLCLDNWLSEWCCHWLGSLNIRLLNWRLDNLLGCIRCWWSLGVSHRCLNWGSVGLSCYWCCISLWSYIGLSLVGLGWHCVRLCCYWCSICLWCISLNWLSTIGAARISLNVLWSISICSWIIFDRTRWSSFHFYLNFWFFKI